MIHVISRWGEFIPNIRNSEKDPKAHIWHLKADVFQVRTVDGNQKSGDHLPVDMENFPLFYHGFKHHSRWLAWGISEPSTVC